jgi:ABC-2 type transport system ATP-binding protein
MCEEVIKVNDLCVKYGNLTAINHMSLSVHKDEVLGIIGENGAGKTTLVECISGINTGFSGNIEVLGEDITKVKKSFYNRLSIQLQEASFPGKLRVVELCELFSSYYDNPLGYEALIKAFDLQEKRKSFYDNLSGGQKQKLSIIIALLANADITIMDELTTGLDPQSRRQTLSVLKDFISNKTILLTTHYLEEAEILCDRVCIISKGNIVKIGKLNDLYEECGIAHKVSFHCDDKELENKLTLDKETFFTDRQFNRISIMSNEENLEEIVKEELSSKDIKYSSLQNLSTNLEDLYFKLVGEKFKEI